MTWTKKEEKLLRSLHTPQKIQSYLEKLTYNPNDTVFSPRNVMMSKQAHCLEGCLLALAALELQGHKPTLVNLLAHNDDHHVLAVYKTKNGWGSIAKSNTTLLGGRLPYYKSIRELVMSYFDFYFNTKNEHSLYAFSKPINLHHYEKWNWRTTDVDLLEMGILFTEVPHEEIVGLRELKKIPKVKERLKQACFFGADPKGLYRA